MLKKLIEMFAGKNVRITNTNEQVETAVGVCKTVHKIPGAEADHFDIELESGDRFGFVPEVVTDNSTDGELRAFARGRRKVEVVS